ncbi:glycosyltransferase family protein [Tenacibaculum singaporense]|uniref:hypothetical protein n=1 Tax=Tenacibaculum singaporense TaxID=2358479 RepID=UPI000F667CC8|nr:hypothetical protein [Tenacibaculum singaporense]RSC93566.1 hypothetical protein EI424_10205 [Tenacibaculum singaporense]
MKIIITKGDTCTDHVRVKKFIRYFDNRKIELEMFCWLREKEKEAEYEREKFIFKGGNYANKKLALLYPLWVIKLFFTLIFSVKNSKNNIIFAIDFDSALSVYLFTFFKPKVRFLYDIHDDFALRYNFPSIIKSIISWIDDKIKSKAHKVVHVDENRVRGKDSNYEIIYNSQEDYYKSKSIEPITELSKEFAFTGLLGYTRGIESVYKFARDNQHIKFIIAGKIIDNFGKRIIELDNVDFLGYISQEVLFEKIKKCLGIFSLYDPSNEINVLAASNKLYDGIMLGVPIIVNKGLAAEKFVKNNEIGTVVNFEYDESWQKILDIDVTKYNYIRKKGRELYAKKYSYEKNIEEKMDKILEEL